ncbi:hypothetical protein DRQ09_03135 [candidate division KSB1 bacterium]|nr:MAG: hypothetical protein DRQ09_03135 [candidate division KSB1 bacterium]
MLEEKEKHIEERISIIGSFIIHILVLVLFLLVTVEVKTEIPEYSVVELADVSEIKKVESKPQVIQKTLPAKKELVELPKRSFNDLEKPEIPYKVNKKIGIIEEKSSLLDKLPPVDELKKEPVRKIKDLIKPEKKEKDLEGLRISNRILKESITPEPEMPLKSAESFSIDWMAGTRVKISGDIPKYPEGINKEVTIKIKFFVLPDGTVGDMIPLEKGESTLENLCMEALKKWRFNKLESIAPQVKQEGVITFKFQLK